MKKIYPLFNRFLLAALFAAALTPCANCGSPSMGQGAEVKNQVPLPSCCQSHQGCHHSGPKTCHHLMNAQLEGAVYSKFMKPGLNQLVLPFFQVTVPAVRQAQGIFLEFSFVQSLPGSSLVLRI